MDRGVWQTAVHGVAKSWTPLSDFHFTLSLTHLEPSEEHSPSFMRTLLYSIIYVLLGHELSTCMFLFSLTLAYPWTQKAVFEKIRPQKRWLTWCFPFILGGKKANASGNSFKKINILIFNLKHVCLNSLLLLSLQSCPTLCDPIDGSPPGSPVPGILQARTHTGVDCHFLLRSEKWKWSRSVVSDSATPWTVTY